MNRLPRPGVSQSLPHLALKSILARWWQAPDVRKMDRSQHDQTWHGTSCTHQEGDRYPVRRRSDGNCRDAYRNDNGWRHYAAGKWGRVGAWRCDRLYGGAAFLSEYFSGYFARWSA